MNNEKYLIIIPSYHTNGEQLISTILHEAYNRISLDSLVRVFESVIKHPEGINLNFSTSVEKLHNFQKVLDTYFGYQDRYVGGDNLINASTSISFTKLNEDSLIELKKIHKECLKELYQDKYMSPEFFDVIVKNRNTLTLLKNQYTLNDWAQSLSYTFANSYHLRLCEAHLRIINEELKGGDIVVLHKLQLDLIRIKDNK